MTGREDRQRFRELEERVGDLEGQVKKLAQPSWRFVPPYPSPYQPPYVERYVERCCPYLDKCTACPYRHRFTWGDNTTDTSWAVDDGSTWRITA